jgi:hypothetical protein
MSRQPRALAKVPAGRQTIKIVANFSLKGAAPFPISKMGGGAT